MDTEKTFWLFVFIFIVVVVGLWWLFYSQRIKQPTKFERVVATGWLLIRRVVCFAGALLFLVGAIIFAFNFIEGAAVISTFTRLGYALFLLVLSALCVWAAIYGWGQHRGDWKGGAVIHSKNKKRYGWRW